MTVFDDESFNDAYKKGEQFVFAGVKMLAFTETEILMWRNENE